MEGLGAGWRIGFSRVEIGDVREKGEGGREKGEVRREKGDSMS